MGTVVKVLLDTPLIYFRLMQWGEYQLFINEELLDE